MKGHDIVTLVHLIGEKQDPTYQQIGQKLGLSTSMVFDSIERCVEMSLIMSDRRSVNIGNFQKLLQHALPYLFPLRIGGPSLGLPLAAEPGGWLPGEKATPQFGRLVWPSEGKQCVKGLMIEPIHKIVPSIVQRDPKYRLLFSCIEILRISAHPLRAWAAEQIETEIAILSRRDPSLAADPEAALGAEKARFDIDGVLDIGIQHVAYHGFRKTKFHDISRLSGVSEKALKSYFGTENDLFLAISMKNMKTAGQFLGRLVVLGDEVRKEDLKEVLASFLSFLEENENFFRLMLWCYLEHEQPFLKVISKGFSEFVEQLGKIIARVGKVDDPDQILFRGYAYTSVPQWYAFFLWAEARRFSNPSVVFPIQEKLKNYIIENVLNSLT